MAKIISLPRLTMCFCCPWLMYIEYLSLVYFRHRKLGIFGLGRQKNTHVVRFKKKQWHLVRIMQKICLVRINKWLLFEPCVSIPGAKSYSLCIWLRAPPRPWHNHHFWWAGHAKVVAHDSELPTRAAEVQIILTLTLVATDLFQRFQSSSTKEKLEPQSHQQM